ncbi:hypothetical protein [Pseudomonas sp.]|uniref:hypothetical protein n=1 Tax=Pseudomonas sp. TaxID=306 RepID=UPI003F2B263D
MKIKVEQMAWGGDRRQVKIKVSESARWIDFGEMNYTERAELAEQLRQMANELLRTGV